MVPLIAVHRQADGDLALRRVIAPRCEELETILAEENGGVLAAFEVADSPGAGKCFTNGDPGVQVDVHDVLLILFLPYSV